MEAEYIKREHFLCECPGPLGRICGAGVQAGFVYSAETTQVESEGGVCGSCLDFSVTKFVRDRKSVV